MYRRAYWHEQLLDRSVQAFIDQGGAWDDVPSFIDEDAILDIIQSFKFPQRHSWHIRIVLDGIDECSRVDIGIVLGWVQALQSSNPALLCTSLRSGREQSMQDKFNALQAPTFVSVPANNPDIKAFVEKELEERLTSGHLTLFDESLIFEIRNCLVDRAQGMYGIPSVLFEIH